MKTSTPTKVTGRARQRAAGFNMIEAVIGLAVVVIIVGALYSGMNYGLQRTLFNREDQRATQIMVEKMEAIRLYRWDQLWPYTDPDDPEDLLEPFDAEDPHVPEDEPEPYVVPTTFKASLTPGSTSESDQIYSGTMVITDAPTTNESYASKMAMITVNLSWESKGKTRTRSLTTFFARYGMQNNVPR